MLASIRKKAIDQDLYLITHDAKRTNAFFSSLSDKEIEYMKSHDLEVAYVGSTGTERQKKLEEMKSAYWKNHAQLNEIEGA